MLKNAATPGILIITGPRTKYGSGHNVRMRKAALLLRKKKIDVTLLCLDEGSIVDVPLPYSLCILDRRDSAFNPPFKKKGVCYVAIDNRGKARNEADYTIDLLPHFSMEDNEYQQALTNIILSTAFFDMPSKAQNARVTLHDTFESAKAAADFTLPQEKISQREFLSRLKSATRPALYFGQAFFEALDLGLHVQLYPISEYHKKLAVDFKNRLNKNPYLLDYLNPNALIRFVDTIQKIYKENKKHD
ncbi:MAG TPA: hypothetical protein PLY93_04340 [Turneriella sp.]|nr:hypothetical protein [Turneriella sp.]